MVRTELVVGAVGSGPGAEAVVDGTAAVVLPSGEAEIDAVVVGVA
jgi:hypothetical protein